MIRDLPRPGGRYLRQCPVCGCDGLCALSLICIDCGVEITPFGLEDLARRRRGGTPIARPADTATTQQEAA